MTTEQIYTVSSVTREIKRVIGTTFGTIWVEGEVSTFKRHTSGHCYFILKDEGAQLSCAMWRGNASRVNFEVRDGTKIQAMGSLEVYEPQGKYQLIVSVLRPIGVGELQRRFEALKSKLQAEGLFEPSRKRRIPSFPLTVGIVTSPTGAAVEDMKSVAARRWPAARLILAPVRVQGEGAAEEISAAIRKFNSSTICDVLVVGRGGGSIEDLWAFNEEAVARAIYESRIPVVSAVGHEVDFTISDFVADLRAPTPSAAMELILPDGEEILKLLSRQRLRLNRAMSDEFRYLRTRVESLTSHYAFKHPQNLVIAAAQRVDDLQSRLLRALIISMQSRRESLLRVGQLLAALRPHAILERGYSIVRDGHGRPVRDGSTLSVGEIVSLEFARGGGEAEIRTLKSTSS